MRKASKIMSIIAGIFLTLSFFILLAIGAYISLAGVAFGLTSAVTGFMSFVVFGSSGEIMFTLDGIINGATTHYLLAAIACAVMGFLVFANLLGMGTANVLGLVLGIITLVGSGKKAKKGVHIAGIVFAVLYFLLGMAVSFSLLLLVGWLSAGIGLCVFLNFILALLGHIFALIAIKKEKDQPLEEEEEIIVVEEVL